LHEPHERFEPAEAEPLAAVVRPGGREPHVKRRAEPDARDQHAPADVAEESPTSTLCSHRRLPFASSRRGPGRTPVSGPRAVVKNGPRPSYHCQTVRSTGMK